MSYCRSLGYDVEVDIPLMGKKIVSFDLDKVAGDASQAFIDQGYPLLEARVRQSLPAFVQQATTEASPWVHRERDAAINKGASTIIAAAAAAAAVLGIAWVLTSAKPKRKAAMARS